MARLIGKVLLQAAGTLLVATAVIFFLLRVLPGDAATVALGVNATPDALAQWRMQHGTDRPLIMQYGSWLGALFTGQFGHSFVTGRDLTPLIWDRVQVTLILVGLGMLIAVLIAVPLGTLAAIRHRSWVGTLVTGASQIGVAIPAFLLGLLLISFFAVRHGLLPSGGWLPPAVNPLEFARRVALPALTIGLVQAAVLTRYVRTAVVEQLGQNYLRTARAVGNRRWAALWRHGLRNAAIPILTVAGLQIAALLIGAVVVERVFAVPGLGSMLVDSVANRDLQAVQGIVMMLVAVVVAINLLTELAYAAIDPRIRVAA